MARKRPFFTLTEPDSDLPMCEEEWGIILQIIISLIIGFIVIVYFIVDHFDLWPWFEALLHPPVIGTVYAIPSEGNYLWVNKNLIELLALWVVLMFPTWKQVGLDRFLFNKK